MNQRVNECDAIEKKPRRLYLPRATRRLGRQLLEQQCWCWGRDVKRAEGNLLVRYGCQRLPAPGPERAATTYLLRLENDARIALWGFGLFYGDARGGVYIGRFAFEPKFRASGEPPRVWARAMLEENPDFYVPTLRVERRLTRELLAALLRWCADYEAWTLAELGQSYRWGCLAARGRVPASSQFAPAEMSTLWSALADNLMLNSRR